MKRREFMQIVAGALVGTTVVAGNNNSVKKSVAIIGHTGQGNYGHGMDTLWLSFPEISIAAIADKNKDGLQKAGEKLKTKTLYSDYRVMLRNEKPDLLCVAPRHIHEHRDMLMAGIEYGVKGIYVEKPFCRNLREAEEIISAAEKNGTKIALAHRNRYHPVIPKVQQLIESGISGQILEIRMRGKEDHRGGVQDLWVLGSHVLNLAPLFAGKLTACSAMIYQDERPATNADMKEGDEGIGPVAGNRLHARFETESGTPVFFESIRGKGTSDANFGMQIFGTKGIFDIRIDTEPLVHFLDVNINKPQLNGKNWTPVSSEGIGIVEPINNIKSLIEGHQAPINDLLACIENNRQPLCNMYEGKASIQAIMGVLDSHTQGGKRVLLAEVTPDNPLLRL